MQKGNPYRVLRLIDKVLLTGNAYGVKEHKTILSSPNLVVIEYSGA
jgi:hypothetical protein